MPIPNLFKKRSLPPPGDGHTRSHPWDLSFTGLHVTAGDILEFRESSPGVGDYIGLKLTITTHANAVPDATSGLLLFSVAAGAFRIHQSRRIHGRFGDEL